MFLSPFPLSLLGEWDFFFNIMTYFPFDATHKSPHSIISDTHLNAFSHFHTEPDCMFLVQTILRYLREVDSLFSQSIGFYENGVELTTYRTVRGNARVVEKSLTQ